MLTAAESCYLPKDLPYQYRKQTKSGPSELMKNRNNRELRAQYHSAG